MPDVFSYFYGDLSSDDFGSDYFGSDYYANNYGAATTATAPPGWRATACPLRTSISSRKITYSRAKLKTKRVDPRHAPYTPWSIARGRVVLAGL
ncbi:unnamed protein product [Boreogadus saida]